MTGRPPLVETAGALTPGWLTAALAWAGHLDGATVTEVAVTPVGTGQMCDSVRVALGYDRATPAPATLVAKLPAADPTSRSTGLALRSYEKEVRFYQRLATTVAVRTPRPYYTDIDTRTGGFVLLLEDMAPATPGDQMAGCSPATARAALDELVRLHAPRWDDGSLATLDWLAGDPDTGRGQMLALLPALWGAFCERYGSRLPEPVRVAGEVLFGNLDGYLGGPTGPRTLVHGDYRLDNLLFGPSERDVAVVDWQTCSYGPALADVAYFLGAGMATGARRRCEHDLVRGYHAALAAAGVAGYAWDDCWLAYRRGTWSGLLVAVGASMMVERTDRGDEMFLTMADRHARHALDLDAGDLITA